MVEQSGKTHMSYDRIIRVDLSRSLPSNPLFMHENELGQKALFRVLHAYALYDKELTYCQGMNFLAVTALCYVPEEVCQQPQHILVLLLTLCHSVNSLASGCSSR